MAKNKVALISGVTGQDGAYLSELLLSKGYEVHGIKRRSSMFNTQRVDHIYKDPHKPGAKFKLHYGDLTDSTNQYWPAISKTLRKRAKTVDLRKYRTVCKYYLH